MWYYSVMVVDDALRIRVIRAIAGMKQGEFCKRLGINPNTLSQWESGKHAPRGDGRKKLAQVCAELNISIRPDGFPVPVSE